MKRILIFSVAYYPFVGGAEIALKEITNRLAPVHTASGNDLEFDMITLNLNGHLKPIETIGSITVHRIGGPGRFQKLMFPFKASRYAAQLHRERQYAAIWSMMASFSGFAALFFKKEHPDVPFLLTLQEGDPIDYIKRQVWMVSGWFKQIFTYANHIQAISSYLAGFAQSMKATAPITVIPNGVDVDYFSQPVPEPVRQEILRPFNPEPQDVFLITTSRLVAKNGVADIIRALVLLPANIKLLILGDGQERKMLEDFVMAEQLTRRVFFLGEVPYTELPKYLHACHIFVRPSLSEGMGNSFIEAMAAGIPIIGTPVGGIPDFLKDGETGLFCNPRDPESLAGAVTKLIENPELKDRLTTQAHTLVEEKYNWHLVATRMKNEVFNAML